MSQATPLRHRWALALLWVSLLLGLTVGPITPVLLPWEPIGAGVGAGVGERLMLGLSTFALLALLIAITAGRRWAWWVFAAYYLLNLTVSVRLAGLLLVLAGPFGIPYALQVACQGAALLLRFVPEALGLFRLRRSGQ